jgi:hypothetical protein
LLLLLPAVGQVTDSGIATIATANTLPAQTTTAWTDAIGGPAKRSETLSVILHNRVHSDLAAAKQFVCGDAKSITC